MNSLRKRSLLRGSGLEEDDVTGVTFVESFCLFHAFAGGGDGVGPVDFCGCFRIPGESTAYRLGVAVSGAFPARERAGILLR